MAMISDEHVEWAIVNRLREMLATPPKTKFTVTQAFATFTTIVLWTKNRMWVGGNSAHINWFNDIDRLARQLRVDIGEQLICEEPWGLSRSAPARLQRLQNISEPINSEFCDMRASDFFEWLRNALAHGDGRSITPIHGSDHRGELILAGFEISGSTRSKASGEWKSVILFKEDMVRLGSQLAESFCRTISGQDAYFEQDAATAARMREVA